MTDSVSTEQWSSRADRLQDSLEPLFGATWPQYLHNAVPPKPGGDTTFNYWWLAHLIDCRLDAFARTGSQHRLEQATLTHDNILVRNEGILFNDYFDDMLWFALSTLRLADASGEATYLDEVVALWDHIIQHGWNDSLGTSLAWRKQQLAYKNTPANGPLAILSARLFQRSGDDRFLSVARTAFDWLTRTLVEPDGFVEDGINRLDDGKIDLQWEFTYNQGVYIGAACELWKCGVVGDLGIASRTALTAINRLSNGDVFLDEGDGGDEGLFKGVFYRYATLLVDALDAGSATRAVLIDFIRRSTDSLWDRGLLEVPGQLALPSLLAGNDWSVPPKSSVFYSTELSAIMAAEARAHINAISGAPSTILQSTEP